MEIRRKRKEALKGRAELNPLKLVAVTHECTLRQVMGSPQILRDQLDELLVRSHEPARVAVLGQASAGHDVHVNDFRIRRRPGAGPGADRDLGRLLDDRQLRPVAEYKEAQGDCHFLAERGRFPGVHPAQHVVAIPGRELSLLRYFRRPGASPDLLNSDKPKRLGQLRDGGSVRVFSAFPSAYKPWG